MVHVDSYVKEYKSHPNKTLACHTLGVKEKALSLVNSKVVEISSFFHDTGKLNPNFKKRLEGKNTKGLYCNHSYLSLYAFLSFYREYKNNNKTFLDKIITTEEEFLIVSLCIVKHHGGIPNLDSVLGEEEFNRLKEFLKTEPYLPIADFLFHMGLNVDFKLFDIEFNKLRLFKKIKEKIKDPLKFYIELRMSFSALVAADKGDAGGHTLSNKDLDGLNLIYPHKLNTYIGSLNQESAINKVRTNISKRCIDRLSKAMDINPKQRVFCLTEPTGSGKTLILLSLARVILNKVSPKIFKIIYGIPYLSITEQIFGIVEGIFKDNPEYIKRLDCKATPNFNASSFDEVEEDTVLKKFKSIIIKIFKGKTLKDELIEKVLYEDYKESTFNYPFIVTTFVQLFQSFTTRTNKGLMRFSSLPNSIFLIDEIQSLPPRLYTFFVAMLDVYCKKYNCYAIVSTATMPNFNISKENEEALKLFNEFAPPIEIGDFEDFRMPIFNRYKIEIVKEENRNNVSLEFICNKIVSEDKSTIAIFNTIRDSKEVYLKIKGMVNCPVFLLNSHFFSLERRRILKEAQAMLKAGKRFFLISTQLIEAGVDIDFPVLYRDIAPLPSINQSAGRCNRNSKPGYMGKVCLFCLNSLHISSKNEGLRARTIYNGANNFFLQYSIDAFFSSSKQNYLEMDLFDLQKDYFQKLSERLKIGKWGDDKNLIEQINNFKFADIGGFSIIDKSAYGGQVSFYVPADDDDLSYEEMIKMWIELEDVDKNGGVDLKEIITKRRMMHLHFRKMMDRVIQVHLKENEIATYSEYEGATFDMYKLKKGFYTSEFGFLKEDGI